MLIAASYSGHEIKLDPSFEFGKTEKSEDFLRKFPLGKVPALEFKVGRFLDQGFGSITFYPVFLLTMFQMLGFRN